MKFEYTIHGAPITKKNSQRMLMNPKTKRYFPAPSKQYKAYEKTALKELGKPKRPPLETPLNMKCLYYMPTRRKADLCNLIEATCDIMVRAGILADDNCGIVVSHDGSRVLYDKDNPRVEVVLEDAV